MEKAWLVVNAFLRSGSFLRMEKVLMDAAWDAGIEMAVKTNDSLMMDGSFFDAPRAALFFDKDLLLARRMEMHGIRLYNSADAIAVCDDKTLTTLALQAQGVAQPDTLLCPMTYPGIGFGDLAFLEPVADALGFPMVVKEGKGSFGQQVYLAHDLAELKETVVRIGHSNLLFQRFIRESAGKDLRLYVVAGEVIAAIRRENLKGDFRANLENGASATPYTPSAEETSLALAACSACGTAFAGVDLLMGREGPLVCEVNSNAHFLGLMAATGVNPARQIVGLLKGCK